MPYSESTKDLIDQLLKDKKVSWRKQREIKHAMSVGSALPSRKLLSYYPSSIRISSSGYSKPVLHFLLTFGLTFGWRPLGS